MNYKNIAVKINFLNLIELSQLKKLELKNCQITDINILEKVKFNNLETLELEIIELKILIYWKKLNLII